MDNFNLWDQGIWQLIWQFAILFSMILLGNTLRRKISFFKRSLIPTSVFAGFLALGLKYLCEALDLSIVNNVTMEAITYHALALGFISLGLKVTQGETSKQEASQAFTTGLITVGAYIVQGIIGLAITILLAYTFLPDLFAASGLLLPLGFGQGSGQALNFGKIYESFGFQGGPAFGLSIAAIGFLFACVGGVIYLNYLLKKGKITLRQEGDHVFTTTETIDSPNEIPISESVDRLTIQFALIFLGYGLTYLLMFGVQAIIDTGILGEFGVKTVLPLVFGFNFLFGAIFAALMKIAINYLHKKRFMTRTYPNNFMLNRIGGFMFDLMIVAGICAIKIEDLNKLWLPLLAICIIGGFITFFYVKFLCEKLFPEFAMEHTLMMYGMLTGTASTGMILLREVDPNFQSPSARIIVLQVLPAAALGFPMLLIVGYAPKGELELLVSILAILVFFIFTHFLMFRNFIFKRKKRENKIK